MGPQLSIFVLQLEVTICDLKFWPELEVYLPAASLFVTSELLILLNKTKSAAKQPCYTAPNSRGFGGNSL
jgi:hypothetical protein